MRQEPTTPPTRLQKGVTDMKVDGMVRLIYPENRIVTETQIMIWHADAVVNDGLRATNNLAQAITDLEDLGHITVGK